MLSLRRILRGPDQSVRSFAVQAGEPVLRPETTVFEALIRHILDRLVNNEALGEDIPSRITQLAYAIALPGVLVALYLFPAYHQPHAIGPRPEWLQIADHYFYVVYAFVIMGSVIVFEWDLLFPDLLDVFVLTTMPISQRRLLLARLCALAIFFTLTLLGTNILGTLFFPAVADLHWMWWHHLAAHFAAIAVAGAFTASFFVALQGMLLCVFGRRLFQWVSPVVQAFSILLLLSILFLFPLQAGNLKPLLQSASATVRFFPPLWFLGLYEYLLWGRATLPIFAELARTGLLATAFTIILAVATYPIAYARRTRQLIEGSAASHRRSSMAGATRRLLHLTFLRSPQYRAVYHFVSQTLLRTPRLHLYLSIYAGLGLSLALSGILLLRIQSGHVGFAFSSYGIRCAIPILVFFTVIGLRTALRASVGLRGNWLFHVIHGNPLREHLYAADRWVALCASLVSLVAVAALRTLAPSDLRGLWSTLTQLLVAIGMSVLLTDVFFLRAHTIPFTAIRQPSTKDLPISFVLYFVIFPAFVLYIASLELWIEASPGHFITMAFLFLMAHLGLRRVRDLMLDRNDPNALPDTPFVHRLGLQE